MAGHGRGVFGAWWMMSRSLWSSSGAARTGFKAVAWSRGLGIVGLEQGRIMVGFMVEDSIGGGTVAIPGREKRDVDVPRWQLDSRRRGAGLGRQWR